MNDPIPTNQNIAKLLEQIAALLEFQHANPHRIRAYRRAAQLVQQHEEDISAAVFKGNDTALESIPGIGESLSRLITEYVRTGNSKLLQRLQGEVTPEELFEQIPGIGKELAREIVNELHLKSLEELEQAALDGRLAQLKGFGIKRVASIQLILAGMLSGYTRRRNVQDTSPKERPDWKPPVEVLLEIDRLYREKAAADELKKISPRRFNPNDLAWLPIFHTEMDDWDFTALFSNTARAHDLKKTNDWVVIFYEKNGIEDQATVVTEPSGNLKGKRVVRGREIECSLFYKNEETLPKSLWAND